MADSESRPAPGPRQGKAWSVEEDRRLYDGIVAGHSVYVLAAAHERSAGGMRARPVRLGLTNQNGQLLHPLPPFAPVRPRRTPNVPNSISAAELDFVRQVFGVRTDDGWIVELRSNRPLSREAVDRLMSMLHGVVGGVTHSGA